MSAPLASVIVRAKNKEATIGRTLSLLRRQTVESEIIVVDSGSADRTLEIAKQWCDRLVVLPEREFTYGRALNLGAQVAEAPTHFALSAHCFPPSEDWIERSLAHYGRDDVAGTSGFEGPVPSEIATAAHGGARTALVYQDAEVFRLNPFWGFSNHASSWRRTVWNDFPFDESIVAAEDKEWAWRVTRAGWTIAMDRELSVPPSHRFEEGFLPYYRRVLRGMSGVTSFFPLPPYSRRDLLAAWWNVELNGDGRSRPRLRCSPWRSAALLARYRVGQSREGGQRD